MKAVFGVFFIVSLLLCVRIKRHEIKYLTRDLIESSHSWDISQCATRKHCITSIYSCFVWSFICSLSLSYITLCYVNVLAQTSSLVASEILKHQSPSARATVIEKWSAVAEVCRNLHNFNSVLEITSAFMSSSIYRLKKTWEKVSKQVMVIQTFRPTL